MRINKLYYLLAAIFITNIIYSQVISGVIVDNEENLIYGCTIYNSTNLKSVLTNENGVFSIQAELGENKLYVSYEGCSSKKINVIYQGKLIDLKKIILQNNSLDEVVVSGTLKKVSKLKSAVPVELYTSDFFRATPKSSFFEAIQGVNGIRPQLNCNVCNTGDIHINGQEGSNTMVLIDGLPLVSGLSTVYGLSGIPQ